MNERIRELVEQLGPVATIGNWGRVKWADDVYPQFGDKMYAAIDLERFAELIVEECIDAVLDADGEEEYDYLQSIRKRFGVTVGTTEQQPDHKTLNDTNSVREGDYCMIPSKQHFRIEE